MALNNSKGPSKSERTKAQIVSAALRLFSQLGYENTTMRAIAKEAGLSLGAAYYYFDSKDELILAFYRATAAEAEQASDSIFGRSTSFTKRMESLLTYKFQQLHEQRALIKILARYGTEFSHPLSPFSRETKQVRDSAILQIANGIEGSKLRIPKRMQEHLPILLWLYQMGLILFWANDNSPEQEKTYSLMKKSLHLLETLLSLASLPFANKLHTRLSEIIELILSVHNSNAAQDRLPNNKITTLR